MALEPESRDEPASGKGMQGRRYSRGTGGAVWSKWVVHVWGEWGADMEGGHAVVGIAPHAKDEVLFSTGHQEPQNSLA